MRVFAAVLFGTALGLALALRAPTPAHATPDCSADQSAGSYCADGGCRNFEVTKDGVHCLDNALAPLLPPVPDVEFEIGVGAGAV